MSMVPLQPMPKSDHVLTVDEGFSCRSSGAAGVAALDHDADLLARRGQVSGEGWTLSGLNGLFDVFGLAHIQGRGVQAVEAFLPAMTNSTSLASSAAQRSGPELGHGRGIDAAAERAQRARAGQVGHDVHRLRVFELGRGSELNGRVR